MVVDGMTDKVIFNVFPEIGLFWYEKASLTIVYRPIHNVKLFASNGDQLEYNGSQGASGSD